MVTADEINTETHQMEAATEQVQGLQGSSKASIAVLKRPDDVKKIEQLWTEGFKLFVGQDYEAASEKLSQATELSVDLYGQFAPQGYQPHYYYGRAMTEIARAESMVVKPPVDDDDLEVDSSEDEQEDEAPEADIPKNSDDVAKDNANGEFSTEHGTDIAPEAPVTEKAEKQLEASETVQQNADQTLKTEDGEDVDELTAAKLAWESLEVARSICDKQEQTTEWMEKKADVLIALGECILVDENFGNALEEFKAALEIQKKIFEPNNRKISETLFQMGLTYRNNDDFESAAASFDKAAEVFKNIIENLQKGLAENDSAVTSEITELKKILEDIQEHAEDALECAKDCKKQMEHQKAVITNVFSQTLKSVVGDEKDEVPVNDISNMIQRKSVKRPATSSDSTITTTTATESTAGEGSSIEAITTECLSAAVEEKAGSEDPSEVKKSKIDE